MGDSGLPFAEPETSEITSLFEDIEMGNFSSSAKSDFELMDVFQSDSRMEGKPDSTPAPNSSPAVSRRDTSHQGIH